ncbi:hypothetical protein BJX66DRAFT_321573 [Aspergillus keveii]|uniref:Altered inheritance of mitochondria protein 9, mitochondrial n=1 Tax=Aspergillus keveii TaxID=714993 RepID=A0ABR4GNV9_9EURO
MLPIPNVLDWSDDSSNPVGAEYIIQQHATGVRRHQIWPTMNSEQHMLCTKALSRAVRKMASLDFPAYGSLYFANTPIDTSTKVAVKAGFCIGPNCNPTMWNRHPRELELYGGPSSNRGPWKDLTSYCLGWLLVITQEPLSQDSLPHQGTVQEYIHLLKTGEQVLKMLVQGKRIQDAAVPTLLHADFHMKNIFVSPEDPTVITGLIDWQSTAIEPAFIYANETPDFAALPEQPDEEDIPETGHPETEISSAFKERALKDAAICYQTYDVCMKGLVPKLRPARLLDPTVFRLFHYSQTTWRDSAAAVHQELIELSARWIELGLEAYEDFETVQRLKLWLKRSLHTNSDGWVPSEKWNAARDAHRAVYDEWIQTASESEARGEDLTVAKADKLWHFDSR